MQKIDVETFKDVRVLVIGDVMIDRYYHGAINRQSPEADVPIVDICRVEDRLGGAANVALNVSSLGANATILSVVGEDKEATFMDDLFRSLSISAHLLRDNSRPTTVKNRIYNDKEYVMRFDEESDLDINHHIEEQLLSQLKKLLSSSQFDIAILQDYNKGVFTSSFIRESILLLNQKGIKIAVDPKKKNFFNFQSISLFKPNLKEVSEALTQSISPTDFDLLQLVCERLKRKLDFDSILLTLSEYGAVAYDKGTMYHSKASKSNVLDVSGAGDTVIAIASLLLCSGFDMKDICSLCNVAGSIVIEQKGVATLSISDFVGVVNAKER